MIMNTNADETLLSERVELEKDVVKLINFGFVKSFTELIKYLRERWQYKWQPKLLSA